MSRKQILCYNDHQSGWGKQLAHTATLRGFRSVLRKDTAAPLQADFYGSPLYVFARIEQFPPLHDPSKALALQWYGYSNARPIIAWREIKHYERKDLQARDFAASERMPETWVCRYESACEAALKALSLPIVSKAAFGSSSSNVRILHTAEEAWQEAKQAFSPQGLSTDARTDSKRGVQQGYVIWQRFLADNPYVYRVAAIGRYRWILRVHNRSDKPMASGSGSYKPCGPTLCGEEMQAFAAADAFFKAHDMHWCAVDMARDHITGEWLVLETTLAWNMRAPGANRDCPVLDSQGRVHPKGYFGRNMWTLLLDEIEAGVFG